jgi:hypothetical protein
VNSVIGLAQKTVHLERPRSESPHTCRFRKRRNRGRWVAVVKVITRVGGNIKGNLQAIK